MVGTRTPNYDLYLPVYDEQGWDDEICQNFTDIDTLIKAANDAIALRATVVQLNALAATVDLKAPLASPALTGIPTAPTADVGTNTQQIATAALVKAAVDALAATVESYQIGDLKIVSHNTSPGANWAECVGTAISRSTYAALFAKVGTLWGVGDGSTTFNLPDFRGRVPVGYDSGDATFNAVGKTGGEKTHLLTGQESGIAAHSHSGGAYAGPGATPNSGGGTGVTTTGAVANTDAVSAHNNLQPYGVIRVWIKVQ